MAVAADRVGLKAAPGMTVGAIEISVHFIELQPGNGVGKGFLSPPGVAIDTHPAQF